jgi:hypothetical protein
MHMPLLSLGLFIFATGQTAIDEMARKSSYRYGSGNAVGVYPTMMPPCHYPAKATLSSFGLPCPTANWSTKAAM